MNENSRAAGPATPGRLTRRRYKNDFMTTAELIMRRFNPNGLIGEDERGRVCLIEDCVDDPSDGRIYRIEIVATPDGRHALAYCRYNPWGALNGGEEYQTGHVDSSGFLCLGPDHRGKDVESSPYELSFVIKRARYWCTAFSVLKETGEFPNL